MFEMSEDNSFDEWMNEFMNKVFAAFPELERVIKGEEFREVVERLESGLPAAFYIKIGPEGPEIKRLELIEDLEDFEEFEEYEDEFNYEIFEDEDKIFVSMEMEDIEKEEIEVRIRANKILEILVDDEIVESIELPAPVKEGSVRASYKNGVLDVTIELKNSSSRKLR